MYEAIVPLFPAGVPGGTELVVILLIAVLLFGANKIPKLARSTGQAMGEFQKGRQQVEQELEEMQEETGLDELTEDDDSVTSTETTTETSTSTSSTGSDDV
ncbi:MAG: twin-arginine translocase TatA/TatE family subunit [Haloarculaceae archaeon]